MFGFMPKEDAFFDLFDRSAANVVRATDLFCELLDHYDRRDQLITAIRETEHTGDRITHDTIERLDRTFITPFDREDIHMLAKKLDDIVDHIDATAKRLTLYGVEKPTDEARKLAATLHQSASTLAKAVTEIRRIKRRGVIMDLLIEIHRLENQGDEQNHAALAMLFQDGMHPIEVIKWKELYERIEEAIDSCEDVANLIEGLVLKNA